MFALTTADVKVKINVTSDKPKVSIYMNYYYFRKKIFKHCLKNMRILI